MGDVLVVTLFDDDVTPMGGSRVVVSPQMRRLGGGDWQAGRRIGLGWAGRLEGQVWQGCGQLDAVSAKAVNSA